MEKKIKGKLFCSNKLLTIIKNIDEYDGNKYKRSISDAYLKMDLK